jgi:ribonuclease P protein component
MLPADVRMRRRSDFTVAVRRGSRAGSPSVSGHLLAGLPSGEPPRVGFIVSRAVGTAVVRNRVKRRLRVLMRRYLGALPRGSLLVVRASPRAATARQADLAADLDLVMTRLLRREIGALHQQLNSLSTPGPSHVAPQAPGRTACQRASGTTQRQRYPGAGNQPPAVPAGAPPARPGEAPAREAEG